MEISITCGADRGEMKDQRAIKGKLDQVGLSFWGRFLREGRRRGSQERFGYLFEFVMVLFEFALGFVWILVCSISRV